jgi:hypothetical protein
MIVEAVSDLVPKFFDRVRLRTVGRQSDWVHPEPHPLAGRQGNGGKLRVHRARKSRVPEGPSGCPEDFHLCDCDKSQTRNAVMQETASTTIRVTGISIISVYSDGA